MIIMWRKRNEKNDNNFAYTCISYSDENDGMASTYSHLMNPIGDGSLLRETYPEESLAS